jgi:hypothetical protein
MKIKVDDMKPGRMYIVKSYLGLKVNMLILVLSFGDLTVERMPIAIEGNLNICNIRSFWVTILHDDVFDLIELIGREKRYLVLDDDDDVREF